MTTIASEAVKKEELVTKKDFAKETVSFIFSVLSTAAGFFLALWVNSLIDEAKDKESFATAQRMILNEIKVNRDIVINSYKYFGEYGITYAELSTTVSEQMIKDQKFISGTDDDSLLFAIQNYHRYIKLLNGYKNQLNALRINDAIKDKEHTPTSYEDRVIKNLHQKSDSLFLYMSLVEKNAD